MEQHRPIIRPLNTNQQFNQFIAVFNSQCQVMYASESFDPLLLDNASAPKQNSSLVGSARTSFAEDLIEVIHSGHSRHGSFASEADGSVVEYSYILVPNHCPIVHSIIVTAHFTQIYITKNHQQEMQSFHRQIGEIFDSSRFPVCLCHPNQGHIIHCNREFGNQFSSDLQNIHPGIFCWDAFQKHSKIFPCFGDWHSIPFWHESADSSFAGQFSVHPLSLGQEAALLFIFSVDPGQSSAGVQHSKNLIESLSKQYSILVAGLGHEVGNVLTILSGNLQIMQELDVFKDFPEEYSVMASELNRSLQLTQEIQLLTDNVPKPTCVYFQDILESLRRFFEHQARFNNVEIIFHYEETPPILADENDVRQVVINLFKNAYESMENGGTIAIGVHSTDRWVTLSIRDQGPGIPHHIAAQIGTPYLTTKIGGTGLGLTISYEKIHANGGSIDFDSDSNGSCFRISFPPHCVSSSDQK